MKHIVIFYLLVALTACGGVIKKGGMVEANNALDRGNFEEAIEYAEIVESFGDLSSEEKAKLHYLRALAQEGLSRLAEAMDNYQYVVGRHSDSAYAALSQRRLNFLSTN